VIQPILENSSYEEVRMARDRAATQTEYRRLDFFLLQYRGYDAEEASEIMDISRASYYRWVNLFNEGGVSSLIPHRSPGRPAKVTQELKAELVSLVIEPEKGGESCWTAIKLHGFLKSKYAINFSYRSLVRYLHECEIRQVVPRRMPLNQDQDKRKEFLEILKSIYEDPENNVYFLDESGFEGDPKPRRRWVPKGHNPKTHYLGAHIRTNVIGAVAPRTGELFSYVVPFVDTGVFQVFLDDFNQATSNLENVYVVLDNASWHGSARVNWGKVKPLFLPAYSPDLTPIEQRWNIIKSSYLGDQQASTYDELD